MCGLCGFWRLCCGFGPLIHVFVSGFHSIVWNQQWYPEHVVDVTWRSVVRLWSSRLTVWLRTDQSIDQSRRSPPPPHLPRHFSRLSDTCWWMVPFSGSVVVFPGTRGHRRYGARAAHRRPGHRPDPPVGTRRYVPGRLWRQPNHVSTGRYRCKGPFLWIKQRFCVEKISTYAPAPYTSFRTSTRTRPVGYWPPVQQSALLRVVILIILCMSYIHIF